MKRHTLFFALVIFSVTARSQVLINEIASRGTIADATGQQDDWIELFNAGATAVNLHNYGLSDDPLNPLKWKFPDITIAPGGYQIVLAAGLSNTQPTNHWETAVYSIDIWKYFVGVTEPDANWTHADFDDGAWLSGMGGIGYGDGDDNTNIASTTSLYIRNGFYVADTSVITDAKLHADYDDAFVAYLNGVEIARSGNILGTPPAYNILANAEHEAGMYAGYPAEEWSLSSEFIHALLMEGTNYLCVQVHNVTAGSSDLSSNFWLSFGIKNTDTYFGATPPWFVGSVGYYQTNFKISNTGETIYLSDPSGAILDAKFTGDLSTGQTVARIPDGSTNWCITPNISPAATNDAAICFSGFEPDPVFSITSGFYSGTQIVSITSPSPTSQIRFTADGSEVTATSPLYTSPIAISSNAVISAKCFSTGTLLPGKMSKQTYFINEDTYTLPVLSISIDPGSLFDYDTGIYELGCCYDPGYPYFGANFWQPWERFGHIEYFTPEGVPQWNKDMSLEIHGGWSRAEAQKGFRVDFKNEYDGSLNYPLWGAKPEEGPINNFNLRNGGQHVWTYKFQDAYLAKIMKDTHIDYEEWQPCMLFINGARWGLYEIREKADENYVESNYGYDNNEIDFLNAWGVLAGSDTGFVNLYNYVTTVDPTSDAFHNYFSTNMDVENYMDYYIGEIYYQNVDFGGYYWGVNNTKVWRHQGGGKWRFIMYDMDGAMGYFGSVPSDNYITLTRNPYYPNAYSEIFDHVLDNIDLRNYFVNRFADLLNTIYLQDNMENTIYLMRDSIISEIGHQVEVWGAPDIGTVDYYIDAVLSYNETRHNTARTQINSSFGLGGQKNVTLSVEPAGAGYIKINTILPDELPWSGIYFKGVPVTITAVANPGYTFSNWDPNALLATGSTDISLTIDVTTPTTFNAVFNGAPVTPALTVTELNYNSNNTTDAGDWIEIYNNGTDPVDLSAWKLTDRSNAYFYSIPFGTSIDPGNYLVIAQDTAKFKSLYPGVNNMVGQFYFNFDNNGDEIKLTALNNNTIIDFTYADSLAWPAGADGTGRTLEISSIGADYNNAGNWFDGCMLGSPGTAYSPCDDPIVFGEINYNSAAGSDAGDWVELWNVTSFSKDISGWKFIDDNDTLLYLFPPGTILDANERLAVVGDITKFTSRFPAVTNYTGPFLFGLDGGGEELRLVDENGMVQFTMEYNDALPWPLEADGLGKTLELVYPAGKMNEPENWFAGCPEGSPATPFDAWCNVQVEDPASVADINIYPNPATAAVFIQLQMAMTNGVQIQLCDNNGKVIRNYQAENNSLIEIKRNNAAAGLYWIRIITGDEVITKQLIWM